MAKPFVQTAVDECSRLIGELYHAAELQPDAGLEDSASVVGGLLTVEKPAGIFIIHIYIIIYIYTYGFVIVKQRKQWDMFSTSIFFELFCSTNSVNSGDMTVSMGSLL